MLLKKISIIAICIALVITGLIFGLVNGISGHSSQKVSYISGPENGTGFGGIFSTPGIDDSLPYSKYIKIQDSFLQKKNEQDRINEGRNVNGKRVGNLGIYYAPQINPDERTRERKALKDFVKMLDSLGIAIRNEKNDFVKNQLQKKLDSINDHFNNNNNKVSSSVWNVDEIKKDNLFYLGLSGFNLKDYSTKFFIDSNTYNLAYVKTDSIKDKGMDNETIYSHYERKKTSIRFSEAEHSILFPITKRTYSIVNTIFLISIFVFSVFGLYVFVGLPVQILFNISKGKAFIKKNISYLKLITTVAVVISLSKILLPYIVILFIKDQIPPEIEYTSPIQNIFDNLPMLIFALVLFLITKAFIRGYKLQQEQDLTI